MTATGRRSSLILALILAYSFAVMSWGAARSPLAPDEARTIFMGRSVLAGLGAVQADAPDPAVTMMDSYLGSAAIAPAAIAATDSAYGIFGARLVGALLCLMLIALLYRTGSTSLHGGRGLLTAAVFVFLGLPLQLSPSATSDAWAAVLLGGALLCVEHAAELAPGRRMALMVAGGSILLSLAAMVDYIAVLFVAPFVLFVYLRHRPVVATVLFLFPLIALLALYGYYAVLPVWPAIEKELAFFHPRTGDATLVPWVYVFNLINMSCLLAVVGIFHKDGHKNSIYMLLLAAPGLLIQLIGSNVSQMHTAALFSLVFLAPAAATGVAQMVELFSYHNDMRIAKPLFTAAIVVVVWVFGIQQIKGIGREHPDLSQAVAFFEGRGSACSSLLVDSDYGSPEFVYRYYFDAKNPPVRVTPLTRADENERMDAVSSCRPDYVVVDSYHSVRSFDLARRDYLAQGFTVAATYDMAHAAGVKNILIFQKGTL